MIDLPTILSLVAPIVLLGIINLVLRRVLPRRSSDLPVIVTAPVARPEPRPNAETGRLLQDEAPSRRVA